MHRNMQKSIDDVIVNTQQTHNLCFNVLKDRIGSDKRYAYFNTIHQQQIISMLWDTTGLEYLYSKPLDIVSRIERFL